MAASTPCIMIAIGPCVCIFLCCWWCFRPAREVPKKNKSYSKTKDTELKDLTSGLRATVGAIAGNMSPTATANNYENIAEERDEEEREREREQMALQEIRDENEAHLREFLMDHLK